MNRTSIWSMFLIGVCFAVSAFAFTSVIVGKTTNVWQSTLPISVTIGTFLTAVVLWPIAAGRSDSLLVSIGTGALIGVVAHPVSAIVSCFIPILLDTYGLLPPPPRDTEWVQSSASENLAAISFVLFWWLLVAVFWLAWLTAAIGAFVGFIIGTAHHFLRPPTVAPTGTNDDKTPPRPSACWNLNPWSSITANVVSLLIISLLSRMAVFAVNVMPELPREEVISEKAAEWD